MPDDTPRPSRSDAAYLAAYLALACGIAFFWQLGNLGLVGPDEPRYAQVAREMWQRGDWLTPTLGGTTWFEKPALLYWLMGFSFQLVGFNEWGPASLQPWPPPSRYCCSVRSARPWARRRRCWQPPAP